MVLCHLNRCAFNKDGYCQDEFPVLDEQGMCKRAWIKGHPNPDLEDKNRAINLRSIVVLNTDFEEAVKEPEKEEEFHQVTWEEAVESMKDFSDAVKKAGEIAEDTSVSFEQMAETMREAASDELKEESDQKPPQITQDEKSKADSKDEKEV